MAKYQLSAHSSSGLICAYNSCETQKAKQISERKDMPITVIQGYSSRSATAFSNATLHLQLAIPVRFESTIDLSLDSKSRVL